MSDDVRVPPIVEAIIRAAAGGSEADRDERASTFARGLALGALVGAAIAGSTIWQRRHARSKALDAGSDDGDGDRPTS
jgi:NhaP-type Na+/H+ or K+/H+ antiporter